MVAVATFAIADTKVIISRGNPGGGAGGGRVPGANQITTRVWCSRTGRAGATARQKIRRHCGLVPGVRLGARR